MQSEANLTQHCLSFSRERLTAGQAVAAKKPESIRRSSTFNDVPIHPNHPTSLKKFENRTTDAFQSVDP